MSRVESRVGCGAATQPEVSIREMVTLANLSV